MTLNMQIELGLVLGDFQDGESSESRVHLQYDKVAPTIKASTTRYWHPIESRVLYPIELAAIQGFAQGAVAGALPRAFDFHQATTKGIHGGKEKDRANAAYCELQRMIGNAVDGAIANALGESLLRAFSAIRELLLRPAANAPEAPAVGAPAEGAALAAVPDPRNDDDDDRDFVESGPTSHRKPLKKKRKKSAAH